MKTRDPKDNKHEQKKLTGIVARRLPVPEWYDENICDEDILLM